ncbi:dynein light chain Tctex-type 1 [Caerostris extrusa]|uniref:Dynein light chain Tctex-type 1 n=1 Tax=Caerostris extrusa TaxID=172846 RepID=A0AAV4M4Q5_CAEEX|nr:dynein light chain Tctex-type 1 [Caerostris extrusa]
MPPIDDMAAARFSLIMEQFPGNDVVDTVKAVINEVFEEVTDNSDIELLAEQWASTVDEKTVWNLSKLNKPFKYIVTCAVVQKNGAGLQMGMSCFWNNNTDGCCTIRWENSFYVLHRNSIRVGYIVTLKYYYLVYVAFSI